MICNKCGKEIKENNSFCTNCGNAVNNKRRKILFIIGVIFIIVVSILLVWNYNIKKLKNLDKVSNNINMESTQTEITEITETRINEMKLDVNIRANTDVEITETWNISIYDFNTLFRTFKLDDSKYEGISNVKVIEIMEDGSTKDFTLIDKEMYHVTKDCYYGLVNSNGDFEIAWGSSTKNATKTYRISYTIENPVKIYNDCAEFYWNFINSEFTIPITKITGKIHIETLGTNIYDVNVWTHSKNKETIEKQDDYIIFDMDNFENENYLELRLAMPRDNFELTNVIDKDMLNQIYNEETESEERIADVNITSQDLLEQIYEKYPKYRNTEGFICTNGDEFWLLNDQGEKMYFDSIETFESTLNACKTSSGNNDNLNDDNTNTNTNTSNNNSLTFKEKYELVVEGMSYYDVYAILGKPKSTSYGSIGNSKSCIWVEGNIHSTLVFNDNILILKTISENTTPTVTLDPETKRLISFSEGFKLEDYTDDLEAWGLKYTVKTEENYDYVHNVVSKIEPNNCYVDKNTNIVITVTSNTYDLGVQVDTAYLVRLLGIQPNWGENINLDLKINGQTIFSGITTIQGIDNAEVIGNIKAKPTDNFNIEATINGTKIQVPIKYRTFCYEERQGMYIYEGGDIGAG